MFDIARFTQILIACLLAVVLAAGTMPARADNHFTTTNQAIADCAKEHRTSGDKHTAKYPSGQAQCCSIGHCWVATEIGAPFFAVAETRLKVADLTNLMTVSPPSARLERPPQTI